MVDRSRDTGAPVSVLVADIHRFKTVNDSFGHIVGDRCLQDGRGHTERLDAPRRSHLPVGRRRVRGAAPRPPPTPTPRRSRRASPRRWRRRCTDPEGDRPAARVRLRAAGLGHGRRGPARRRRPRPHDLQGRGPPGSASFSRMRRSPPLERRRCAVLDDPRVARSPLASPPPSAGAAPPWRQRRSPRWSWASSSGRAPAARTSLPSRGRLHVRDLRRAAGLRRHAAGPGSRAPRARRCPAAPS